MSPVVHRNAPMTIEGRRRLVERCRTRPIAHVAVEMDGGGWRIHGRGSQQAKAVERTKARGARAGYIYLHSAIDGHTRLADTEALGDEKGVTAAAFLDRAREWFAVLAEEFLYARTWNSERERADGLVLWNLHYNYHRPLGAHEGQPPASRTPNSVDNVMASYN